MNRKEKTAILIPLLILSVFTFGSYVLRPAYAVTPNVYVSNPQNGTGDFIFYTNTTSVGFKFNATLWATGFVDPAVYAWQVTMYYNNTILNATRAWLPSPSDSDYILFGHASIRPKPSFGPNYVKIGDTSLDTSVSSATPKKLGIVEFQIMLAPEAGNKVSCILYIDNADTYLLDDFLSDITITKTDGYYEFNSSVTVVSRMFVAVRGDANDVQFAGYNFTAGSWLGWNALSGGVSTDSPAAAVSSDKMYFVVRGLDGVSLFFGSVNLTDSSFSGWTWISGSTPSAPTLTSDGATLALVVRGEDDEIWYRTYDTATEIWTEWHALPSGATSDKPSAALIGATLNIVVRSSGPSASDVWYSSVDVVTHVFSGWTYIPGAVEAAPALAVAPASLKLVVTGTDNGTWINTWNGALWQGWTREPNGSTVNAPAATVVSNSLHFMVIGMDGTTLWYNSLDLGTSLYSGWTPLSGPTASPPTLTH